MNLHLVTAAVRVFPDMILCHGVVKYSRLFLLGKLLILPRHSHFVMGFSHVCVHFEDSGSRRSGDGDVLDWLYQCGGRTGELSLEPHSPGRAVCARRLYRLGWPTDRGIPEQEPGSE